MQQLILIISFLLLVCSNGSHSQNFNFNNTWSAIEEAIEQGLPQTALQQLETLLNKAKLDGNIHQISKATLYQLKLKAELDPSKKNALVLEAEHAIFKLPHSAEKMLMYLFLAETYNSLSNQHHFSRHNQFSTIIDNHTHYFPDNIEEWSPRLFTLKIEQLIEKAFADTLLLQQQAIEHDDLFITTDTSSLRVFTTMYDLMLLQVTDFYDRTNYPQDLSPWYQKHLAFRRSQPEILPLVIAEIRAARYQFSKNKTLNATDNYLQLLDSLATTYNNQPEVIEIFAEKAHHYLRYNTKKGNKRIAFRICEEGIQRFPDYPRIYQLKNIQYEIERQQITIKTEPYFSSISAIETQLSIVNTEQITVELHRLNANNKEYILYQENKTQDNNGFPSTTLIAQKTINLPFHPDFESTDTLITFPAPGYGIYEIKAIPGTHKAGAITHCIITDLFALQQSNTFNSLDIITVDRTTGRPLGGVEATTHRLKWHGNAYNLETTGMGTGDRNGRIKIQTTESYSTTTTLSKGKDQYFTANIYSWNPGSDYIPASTEKKISLFTDRSIYRPGQVLYFKAIAYTIGPTHEQILADTTITIELYNANNSLLGTHKLTTNEFGSASGSFIIPPGGINGNFQLRSGNTQIDLLVEEYKRPGFEVTLTAPDKELYFGQTTSIQGKALALAGYPLQQAAVNYRVYRKRMPFFRHLPGIDYRRELIAEGITNTDNEGQFEVQFTPNNDHRKEHTNFFTFEIEAAVTAQHGESQTGITSVSVGERSLIISTQLPEIIKKEGQLFLKAEARNLTGVKLVKTIFYQLRLIPGDGNFQDQPYDRYQELHNVINPNQGILIDKGSFLSSDSIEIDLKKYTTGKYKVLLYALDARNDTVHFTHQLIVYSKNDRRPPVMSHIWLPSPITLYATPGTTLSIPFGTSHKNAWVLYEVLHGKEQITSRWVRMSNRIRKFRIPFSEHHHSGLTVRFTLIREGQRHSRSVTIQAAGEDKIIRPTLTTFRDKLKPGAEETWLVTISGKQAELLASMYDASLDRYQTHQWTFNPEYRPQHHWIPEWSTGHLRVNNTYWWHQQQNLKGPSINTTPLRLHELAQSFVGYTHHYALRSTMMRAGNALKTDANTIMEDELVDFTVDDNISALIENTNHDQQIARKNLRQNFNETAFFYPHLYADSTGIFEFSATLPESITRWHLDLLAHSKDLHRGIARYSLTTQKEMMVEMSLPRFIRESDSWILKAMVTNLTENQLQPTVRLTITDPVQDTVLLAAGIAKKTLELPAGRTETVEWRIPPFINLDLVICKIEAITESYSDGEQRYLPVVSDRVVVTESVPFSIHENQVGEIAFKQEINPKDVIQVVLEFTSNPVWAAIQALPLLSIPGSHNSIDLLAAWYSTAISSKLARQLPELGQAINALYAKEQTSLKSNLEKNNDLHLLILEATPWLAEAKEQTEQQQQLIRLFDHNQQAANEQTMLAMLRKLQLETGAFVWMEGMQADRQLTQLVATKMAVLYNDTGYANKHLLKPLLQQGIRYLDNQLNYDFSRLKSMHPSYKENRHITFMQLQYLDLRTALPDFMTEEYLQEALAYYNEQIIYYRHSLSIYEKSIAVRYFLRTNQHEYAAQLLRSLKETAVDSPTGMHWPGLQSSWRWDERPLRIHLSIMEAFSASSGYKKEIERMKVWLLSQKRTHHWDDRLTTLEAVMALLTEGEAWFNARPRYTFKANQILLTPTTILPGSGYFRTQLEADVRTVEINRTSGEVPSPSWGAIYRQSKQPIDKVVASGSILRIERKYYLEQYQENHPVLLPIHDHMQVEPGDRIISRISIYTEQSMNYVVLTDNKSAGLEAINPLTKYEFKNGLGYVRSPGDLSVRYYFDYLPAGIHILEEVYFVTHTGNFSAGYAQLQCMYAPEYTANSRGSRLTVKTNE